jgi:hypothetical protein
MRWVVGDAFLVLLPSGVCIIMEIFPSDQVTRYLFLRLAPKDINRNGLNYNSINHSFFPNSQWYVSRSVMSRAVHCQEPRHR